MEMLKKKIEDILESTNEITDLFYQQNEQEGYRLFNEYISKLMDLVNNILLYKEECQLEFNDKVFNQTLMSVINALEKRDTIMVSDILQYELGEQLQELLSKLN